MPNHAALVMAAIGLLENDLAALMDARDCRCLNVPPYVASILHAQTGEPMGACTRAVFEALSFIEQQMKEGP